MLFWPVALANWSFAAIDLGVEPCTSRFKSGVPVAENRLADHQRIKPCSGPKKSALANKAVFMWGRFCVKLHEHGVADQTNGQPLDLERLAGLDHNGLVVGVFGMQFD